MRQVIHAACFPSWHTDCFFILTLFFVPYCFSLVQRLNPSVFLSDYNNLSFSLISVSRFLYLFTEIRGKHLRELILSFHHIGIGNQTQDVWLGVGCLHPLSHQAWPSAVYLSVLSMLESVLQMEYCVSSNFVSFSSLLKTILWVHSCVFIPPPNIHCFLTLHLSQ